MRSCLILLIQTSLIRVSLCKFYNKMFKDFRENDRFLKIFCPSISKSLHIKRMLNVSPLKNISPVLLQNYVTSEWARKSMNLVRKYNLCGWK